MDEFIRSIDGIDEIENITKIDEDEEKGTLGDTLEL